jgi:hypothetical protein
MKPNKSLHLTAIPLRSIASRLCGALCQRKEIQNGVGKVRPINAERDFKIRKKITFKKL